MAQVSKGLKAFFGVEIRNEGNGGDAPATLASARNSFVQAPTDVLWGWFGLEAHECDGWDRARALAELDGLIATEGPDSHLHQFVERK